jgi:hypothetical protein
MEPINHDWTFPECDRLIVIGDLHGDLQRLTQCFYQARLINNDFQWIAEPRNTWVIQLGDQVDSEARAQTKQWETMPDISVVQFMVEMDALAKPHGGRVISLIGNHEIMNVMGDFSYASSKSIHDMGGAAARAHKFRPGGPIASILSRRPVVVRIGELLFCHAGLLPIHLHLAQGSIAQINEWAYRYLLYQPFSSDEARKMETVILGQSSILWTRHYSEKDDDTRLASLENVLKHTKTKAMFLGHTVVPHVIALYDMKLWFVDTGVSRAFNQPEVQILEILNGGVSCPDNKFAPYRVIIVDRDVKNDKT